MQVIRFADLPASPWKNGGGTTRQLLIHPPAANLDNFSWRISMADVASEGPFSRFDGVDRTLAILSGNGLELLRDGAAWQTLQTQGPMLSFAGEWAIDSRLPAGAVRDFNVMTRRAVASHQLQRLPLPAQQPLSCPPHSLLLLAHGNSLSVQHSTENIELATLDSIWLEHATEVSLNAKDSGEAWLISIKEYAA